jgi:hypothetical protein
VAAKKNTGWHKIALAFFDSKENVQIKGKTTFLFTFWLNWPSKNGRLILRHFWSKKHQILLELDFFANKIGTFKLGRLNFDFVFDFYLKNAIAVCFFKKFCVFKWKFVCFKPF